MQNFVTNWSIEAKLGRANPKGLSQMDEDCCCLLFVVCCLLFVVCCLLFVVCCLLFVGEYCLLFVGVVVAGGVGVGAGVGVVVVVVVVGLVVVVVDDGSGVVMLF